MDIRRVIDGKEHIITLSNEEIEQAFRIREHEYLSQDVECQLKELGSVRGLPAELFQNKQFYEDVIYRAEKMDAHNEDIQYAIEDVTERLTDEEIAKYIKPKLVEFCEQMENRVFISDDNTITVCRYYEGRNNAVSRISSYCCPLDDAYDALRTSDPLDELLYRSRVTAIYENEPKFCKEVLRIQNETPTFSASDDDFAAELESKLHTEKYSLVHDRETDKEQAGTEIFALDGKVKYRILETDDQKYKYNVQIWTQYNTPAQTGYVYAGNGRFCETLDDAQSFVEADIADRTDRAFFSQVIEKFGEHYNEMYQNKDQVEGYAEAVAVGDIFITENPDFMSKFAKHRNDFVSSDRETAALAFALVDVGIIEKFTKAEIKPELRAAETEINEWIPGMEISEERYDEMYNVLPPMSIRGYCGFQPSEPYSTEINPATGKHELTYMTFVNYHDKYFYAGTNFAHQIKPEQIDAINEQLKSYSVYVVDDAYNGHKRSEYEQPFKSLDEAIESYKKSRDVGHDIVGICDSNRKHLIKYMDGNETIYLSSITSEANKQKILEAAIEKPVASVQKTHGR